MHLYSIFSKNTVLASLTGISLLMAAAAPLAGQISVLRTGSVMPALGSTDQDRGSGRLAANPSDLHAATSWRGSGRINDDTTS
ncbi:MAG: hypothetical protein KGQ93_02370 [Cyanobacteria bacterium REEB459]|nr:hypothetical protein [Cyanobacteria bacterium REEB459]